MCQSAESCHTPAAPEAAAETAECPVMGNTVVKAAAEAAGLVRDHEGERYWLCCAPCGPTFDADPARYARAA
jgi:YHS domain-containing protein